MPYKLPSLPEHPLPPPVPKPTFRPASVPACVDAPATQCKRPAPAFPALPVSTSSTRVRLPSDETTSDQCMASLLTQAVTVLGREWLSFLSSLSTDSDLFTEASQSANPQVLMLRVVQRFAPSTLERYFAEWRLWTGYCSESQLNPACPHPGALPAWLHSRASHQGLAMGPIRALTWFGKQAGLPHLLAAVHSPMAKSFLSPTNPSERRESLPLPLSFVVWLERLVLNPATTPADVLFYGAVLTCTWASLRWADALWLPPARLLTLVDKGAIVGVCLRKPLRGPCRSHFWSLALLGLHLRLGRHGICLFFARLWRILCRPSLTAPWIFFLLSPLALHCAPLFPVRLNGTLLCHACFRPFRRSGALMTPCRRFPQPLCMAYTPANLPGLGPSAQPASLRRIQGHHRLSGAQQSVELYGRDDAIPMLDFQKLVVQHIRSGFRPLQPMSRGASAPLPDFPVTLPPPAQPRSVPGQSCVPHPLRLWGMRPSLHLHPCLCLRLSQHLHHLAALSILTMMLTPWTLRLLCRRTPDRLRLSFCLTCFGLSSAPISPLQPSKQCPSRCRPCGSLLFVHRWQACRWPHASLSPCLWIPGSAAFLFVGGRSPPFRCTALPACCLCQAAEG